MPNFGKGNRKIPPAKVTLYQIWHETEVGPIFSTKQKAIEYLERDGEKYNPNDYPDIREFELDTGHIDSKHEIEYMDR